LISEDQHLNAPGCCQSGSTDAEQKELASTNGEAPCC
jgi:hypothetical protein